MADEAKKDTNTPEQLPAENSVAAPAQSPLEPVQSPLEPKANLAIDEKKIAVIRPGGTKHGPRGLWRELEFAQLAIQSLYGANPPKHIDRNKLTSEVNDWLQKECREYKSTGYGEISKATVIRALKKTSP
jgi:hypothetical protein